VYTKFPMCLRAGFTGTREKLTSAQLAALREFLLALRPYRGDHGDCVGADTAFHMVLRELEVPVTLHPPTNSEFRSFVWTSADLGDVVCVEKNYLERNEDIVRDTDFLIACPEGPEVMRSGTWATVRYARKKGRTIVVFWPDGHTDLECAT